MPRPEQGPEELPEWAREDLPAPGMLALHSEGLVFGAAEGPLAFEWDEVLGATLLDFGLHVMVPREPPEAPWFVVGPAALGELGMGAKALIALIRTRTEERGYRSAQIREPKLPPEALLRKVRAREWVPGAMEVPVAWAEKEVEPISVSRAILLALGGMVPFAVLFAYVGAMVGEIIKSEGSAELVHAIDPNPWTYSTTMLKWGLLFGCAFSVVAAITYKLRRDWLASRPKDHSTMPRVLVLAPDGFVIGLSQPSGVRAFAWEQVGGFTLERGSRDTKLTVWSAEGKKLGAVASRFFGAPMRLVLTVAEVYRERAARR